VTPTEVDVIEEKHGLVRFIVVGDSRGSSSGINETILAEIAQAILEEDVRFILFPGDLVNGSSNPTTLEAELLQWRDVMQPVYDAGIAVYPCRGNHDAHSKAVWDTVFSGPYALPDNGPSGEENITFSLSPANILFVGLDQYANRHRINQAWLEQQFNANTRPHVFVFGHEPAFKVRHSDCLDDYPDNRDTLWHSIAAEGGRVYFCGHDHFYDHARLDDGDDNPDNDLHQFVVGTAGAPLRGDGSYNGSNGAWTPQRVYHERQFGYVLVEVEGSVATLSWKHRIAAGVYEIAGDVFTYTAGYISCCIVRGDIDRDGYGPGLADLSYVVDYMFTAGPPPPCAEEGNVDADARNEIGISDLVYLIDYLFCGGPPPPPCPQLFNESRSPAVR